MSLDTGVSAYSVYMPNCWHDHVGVVGMITLMQYIEISGQGVFIVVFQVMLHSHCGITGSSQIWVNSCLSNNITDSGAP